MKFLKVLLISIFLISLCTYGLADIQDILQDPKISNLIKPFAFYVKDIKQGDIYTLIDENKILKNKIECILNSPYIEKEFLDTIIASYIILYTIKDVGYIFVTEKDEILPVFLTSIKGIFKGKDPNFLGIEYKNGYIKENKKLYNNVDLIKIGENRKAVIISKKGIALKVKKFRFLYKGDWFYYTPYNPITSELNILKVDKLNIKYIIFSPYFK